MRRRTTLALLLLLTLFIAGCDDDDGSTRSDVEVEAVDQREDNAPTPDSAEDVQDSGQQDVESSDTQSSDTQGSDTQGIDTASSDTQGSDTQGSDTQGSDTSTSVCEGLTDWEQMMLDDHNRWRESVDPPAAQMHRLYWDREIAENAAQWVSSCDPDWPHSPESTRSDLGGYEVLGENLSYCAGTGCAALPMVQDGSGQGDGVGWWEERHDYDWANDSSSGVTAHYTQMVSANVYAIGCATQRCDPPGPWGWDSEWWWTICQYGPRGDAYWSGNRPYEQGDGGLVEPSPSVFEDHPGLCGE